MFKQFFCNHDYETEKTIQSPSKMETFVHSGGNPDLVFFPEIPNMCKKKLVVIQKCKKCQKSKITTVTT